LIKLLSSIKVLFI